jgi:group I intron endonuclease
MDLENGIIYIATNLVNGKQYVGQTVRSIKDRIYEHKTRNKKTCPVFHSAIVKYNISSFKWVYFEYPIENLDWAENFWIKTLDTISPNGYNLDSGGNTTKRHHNLSKLKMKMKKLGQNNPNFGRIGEKHPMFGLRGEKSPLYGKPRPESFKLKMKKIMEGDNHPNFGNHLSQTTREKISKALKNKSKSEKHKLSLSKSHKGQTPWNKGKLGWKKKKRQAVI